MVQRIWPLIVLSSLALGSLHCQRMDGPRRIPSTDQWRRVQENILPQAPEIQHVANTEFAGAIRLLGWEISEEQVDLGGSFELTLFWEALQPVSDPWKIFVHLDGSRRQTFDHDAINGFFPTQHWEPGTVIRDKMEIQLDSELQAGEVPIYVGLFRGEDRMSVSDPGAATAMADHRLRLGSIQIVWEPLTYEIRHTRDPIVIDGYSNESAWMTAANTRPWVHPVSGDDIDGKRTVAKMLWDDDNLYIFFRGIDPDAWATIQERDGNLWEEEVFEFYFDGNSNGRNYLEFQINPLNTVFDALFEAPTNRNLPRARAFDLPGLETAVSIAGGNAERGDNTTHWQAEVKIPLDSLPSFSRDRAHQGESVRVNFYRYDRPSARETLTFAWSPVGPGSFHNPDRFGVATFARPSVPRRPQVNNE